MLHALKKMLPAPLLDTYHRALSVLAAKYYGNPSEKLIVVGVTGTNGKTTTSYLTAKVLEALGDQSGCTTTALFKIGKKEWLNDRKMTMLGRFQLQKMLRDMVDAGCKYAVVETSSQGILQHRHEQIHYDVCVFTNLTPEHIEAHGGFENYKQAKIELFRHLAKSPKKKIEGKEIARTAVLNRMDPHAKDFAVPGVDRVMWYGIGDGEGVSATDLKDEGWSMSFTVEGERARLNLPGEVNVENALAAITVAESLGFERGPVLKKLAAIPGVPGRFERIDEGQSFSVIVDYAPEPASLTKLYEAIEKIPHQRLIHVFGSCGGGRDVARRPVLGAMAAKKKAIAFITNEDPYDDQPRQIMEQVADGARQAGMPEQDLHLIDDRRMAIFAAIKEARPGDLVLLTGKGCEQAIMGAQGSKIPWDERQVVREALHALED